jgi:hypothetical protein
MGNMKLAGLIVRNLGGTLAIGRAAARASLWGLAAFVAVACNKSEGGGGQGGAAASSSTGFPAAGGSGGEQTGAGGGVAGMGGVGMGGVAGTGSSTSNGSGLAGSAGGSGGAGGAAGSAASSTGAGGACVSPFADCNADPLDGCEADLDSDPKNCGICGAVCATGLCTAALCHAAACNGGPGANAGSAKGVTICFGTRADCNGQFADGCEINLERDPLHCGVCGNPCASGFCTGGTCAPMPTVGGVNGCPAGTLDCDGNMSNGCETDVANDPSHCGDCFFKCPGDTPTSTPTCALGRCGLLCNAGQADCDLSLGNSCQWSLNDPHACGGCGHRCDPSDCNDGTCWHPAVPLATGGVHSIAVDATSIYWTNGASTVRKLPLNGGCETVLVTGANGAAGIAVDATSVYFASPAGGTINKVPLGGGAVTVLASGQESVQEIAINQASVFWVTFGTQSFVRTVPKAGGTVQTLAPAQYPRGIAVDDADVYWTENAYVKRVPTAGGAASIFTQWNTPRYVALDATHVYISDPGSYLVVWGPKNGVDSWGQAKAWATAGKVTVDNGHVYWTSVGAGVSKATKIAGVKTNLLGHWAGLGTGIAVDATGVYMGMEDGTLWKVAK